MKEASLDPRHRLQRSHQRTPKDKNSADRHAHHVAGVTGVKGALPIDRRSCHMGTVERRWMTRLVSVPFRQIRLSAPQGLLPPIVLTVGPKNYKGKVRKLNP
jgi:hypothetical protein